MRRANSLNQIALFIGVLLITVFAVRAQSAVTGWSHDLTTPATVEEHSKTCPFCHTPSGELHSAPRWLLRADEASEAQTRFPSYDSLGQGELAQNARGSVSFACLACHDGVQAPDVAVVGAPNGIPTKMDMVGLTDHPVGIPYGGRELYEREKGKSLFVADEPFVTEQVLRARDFRVPESDLIGGSRSWWIDTGLPGRQKTDLPLFTGNGYGATPAVECATCHDPHLNKPLLLRVDNTGSRLCLSCHDL